MVKFVVFHKQLKPNCTNALSFTANHINLYLHFLSNPIINPLIPCLTYVSKQDALQGSIYNLTNQLVDFSKNLRQSLQFTGLFVLDS